MQYKFCIRDASTFISIMHYERMMLINLLNEIEQKLTALLSTGLISNYKKSRYHELHGTIFFQLSRK